MNEDLGLLAALRMYAATQSTIHIFTSATRPTVDAGDELHGHTQ
jgi:hypothetical protein